MKKFVSLSSMVISSLAGGLLLLVPLAPAWAQTVVATIPVGISPVAVASNSLTNKIYVANSGSVTVIDGQTNHTTTVQVGLVPIAIAVNPVTNKIYVANRGNILKNIRGSVTVIDGATNSTATIRDPNATFPSAIAVNPVTNKIYVTNESDNVTVIDGRTHSTTTLTDHNAAFPVAVAVNPVTNKIYVANVDSANVTVIDGATNATTTVPVTLPNVLGPVALAVNSLTDKIYVANNGVIRGSTNAGHVTVIDGRSNATIKVTDPHAITPLALAVNPLTNKIYVANEGDYPGSNHGNVTVIDGRTNSTITVTDPHALAPLDVALNPQTNKIYVTNANRFVNSVLSGNGGVTVINGSTNSVAAVTDPRAKTDIPGAIAVDPVTDRIYAANVISNNVSIIHDSNSGLGTTAKLFPTSLNFGTVAIGTTSRAEGVTLTNVGATTLTITGITITGTNAADFLQTHTCGSSLAAGTSCGISVTFNPTASGTRTAALSVSDNAAGSPEKVSLSGTGTTAKLIPSGLIYFGSVQIGMSAARTVTLTNVGATTLTITGITITGTDFLQTDTCGSSLAAGASCSISVTFKPTRSGLATATLSVADNASGSPQTVPLAGGCIPQGGFCYGPGVNMCCPAPRGHHSFCSNPTGGGTCIES